MCSQSRKKNQRKNSSDQIDIDLYIGNNIKNNTKSPAVLFTFYPTTGLQILLCKSLPNQFNSLVIQNINQTKQYQSVSFC